MVLHNYATDDTVINFQIYFVAAGFDIRTPMDEDMKILPMYEVTSQLFWDPNYFSHAKNERAYHLSQGVEPNKHCLMMVDIDCEDKYIIYCENLSLL